MYQLSHSATNHENIGHQKKLLQMQMNARRKCLCRLTHQQVAHHVMTLLSFIAGSNFKVKKFPFLDQELFFHLDVCYFSMNMPIHHMHT
jgi:hypothetical protein